MYVMGYDVPNIDGTVLDKSVDKPHMCQISLLY